MTINFWLKGKNTENFFQGDCPEAVAFLEYQLHVLLHIHHSERNTITYSYLWDIL